MKVTLINLSARQVRSIARDKSLMSLAWCPPKGWITLDFHSEAEMLYYIENDL